MYKCVCVYIHTRVLLQLTELNFHHYLVPTLICVHTDLHTLFSIYLILLHFIHNISRVLV